MKITISNPFHSFTSELKVFRQFRIDHNYHTWQHYLKRSSSNGLSGLKAQNHVLLGLRASRGQVLHRQGIQWLQVLQRHDRVPFRYPKVPGGRKRKRKSRCITLRLPPKPVPASTAYLHHAECFEVQLLCQQCQS